MHISVFQPPFFANEAYNIPEQLIVRVLISLPTNETFATFLVSAIVNDDYSYSSMYRYFSRTLYENEAYNISRQRIIRVLISLRMICGDFR